MLPVVVDAIQYSLVIGGTIILLFVVTRVAMQISGGLANNISKQRKYSTIYTDTIQRLNETEKVFEMNEKSQNNSSATELLYDVDMNSEKTFMLDEEPAIPEDEDDHDNPPLSIKVSDFLVCFFFSSFSHAVRY